MIRRFYTRLATLRWRLTLFYCLLLAVLLTAFSLFVYSRFEEAQKQNTLTRLVDIALVFAPTLNSEEMKAALQSGKPVSPDEQLMKLAIESLNQMQQNVQKAGSLDGLYVGLLDPKGHLIASNQPASGEPKLQSIYPHLQPVAGARNAKTGNYSPYAYETDVEQAAAFKAPDGVHEQRYLSKGVAYVQPFWLLDPAAQGGGFASPPDGYLVLVTPIQQEIQTLNQLGGFLVYGTAGTLLLALLLGLPLAGLGLRPLERIAATAGKIGEGDLTMRVPLPPHPAPDGVRDEVQQLARSFNTMLDRIEAAFIARQKSEARTRRFAADASHEMRSPLTVLGGYLDVLLMGAKDDPTQEERILLAMKRENDRLSRLVVDLLLLTRIDSNGAAVLRVAPILAKGLLQQVGEDMRVLMDERTFTVDVSPRAHGAWIAGDSDQLYRVLTNLLDNAVRYTQEDGEITLSADVTDDRVRFTVADNGGGIEASQLPRVFDRFYRADASRARQTGNAGLGLAICKSIVEAHDGQISVESSPGQGTRFIVSLPLLKRDSAASQETRALALP